MVLNCFKCKAEVVFDSEHIGKNGKKIPLDPGTKTPHDCPMREKRNNDGVDRRSFDEVAKEGKDDHGNEEFSFEDAAKQGYDIPKILGGQKYVDHTLKGQSKVKIFSDEDPDVVEDEYNTFLIHAADGKIKVQGAQFHIGGNEFAIALYYEEVKA